MKCTCGNIFSHGGSNTLEIFNKQFSQCFFNYISKKGNLNYAWSDDVALLLGEITGDYRCVPAKEGLHAQQRKLSGLLLEASERGIT